MPDSDKPLVDVNSILDKTKTNSTGNVTEVDKPSTVDGKLDTLNTEKVSTENSASEEKKPSDIPAGIEKPIEEHTGIKSTKTTDNPEADKVNEVKDLPTENNPLGPTVPSNHAKEDKTAIGSELATVVYHVHPKHPEMLQKIEKVLKDGGMDTQSQLRSLQAISQIHSEYYSNESRK